MTFILEQAKVTYLEENLQCGRHDKDCFTGGNITRSYQTTWTSRVSRSYPHVRLRSDSVSNLVGESDCTHPRPKGCQQMMTKMEFWGGVHNKAGII